MIKISNLLMTKENAHLYLPLIQALAEGKTIEYGSGSIWGQVNEPEFIYPPQYYRIKPEPAMVPLGPEDVPPGSAIRKIGDTQWYLVVDCMKDRMNFGQFSWSTYEALQKCFEIKRPGEDWKPCHKPA